MAAEVAHDVAAALRLTVEIIAVVHERVVVRLDEGLGLHVEQLAVVQQALVTIADPP